MRKFIIILTIVTASLFVAHLKADVISDYHLNLTLANDMSAKLDLVINLQNNSTGSVIRAYSLEFPFNIVNAEVRLNGVVVDTSIDKLTNGSRINVSFFDNIIADNSSGKLEMTLFAADPVQKKYNITQLLLPYPESNFKYQEVSTSITYPSLMGSPSLISEYRYDLKVLDGDQNIITLQQKHPLMIVWGNPEYNVGFDLNLKNLKDTSNHYLLGIVPEYHNQLINYININEAEYALTDSLNNVFSLLKLESNNSIPISNSVNISMNSNNPDFIYPQKYNWNLNLDSTMGQKIYSQINQGQDIVGKLNSLNEFLVTNFELDNKKIDLNSLNHIWDNNTKSLNQLQFCYLVVSTAEYLGLQAKVNYGYSVINPQLSETAAPVIWCEVFADGRNITFDIPDQKLYKVSFFNISAIDKLRMGIWYPSQSYNDILGLLINNPYDIKINPPAVAENNESDVSMTLEFPEKVFSGEFYSGTININNNSSKLLRFNELKLNNFSILSNIKVGDLTKSVMPLQKNSIKVDYLRETDFVLDKTITVKVEAGFNENINLNKEVDIRFEPDYKLIGIFLVIMVIIIVILLFLTSRIIKKKF